MKTFLRIASIAIVFLLVFLFLNLIKLNSKNEFSDDNNENQSDSYENIEIGEINLEGTFNENSIKIEEVDRNFNDIKFKIPQISGLKNTDIENKINSDIGNKILDEMKKNNSKVKPNISIWGNFGNVLSIYAYIYGNDFNEVNNYFLNYNLVDGSYLKFEDIFKNDTNLVEIVRSAFYKSLLKRMPPEKYLYVNENDLYKSVKGFLSHSDGNFAVSPANVIIKSGKNITTIPLIEYKDNIAIYSRFKTTESIYKDESVGRKDVFVFSDTTSFDVFEELDFGFAEDNFWYEIAQYPTYAKDITDELPKDVEEMYKAFNEKYLQKYYKEIEKYREVAWSNPDKFYIYLAKPYTSVYCLSNYNNETMQIVNKYSNMIEVNEAVEIYEMPYASYEERYKDQIIQSFRNKNYFPGGTSISILYYDDEKQENCEDENVIEHYENTNKIFNAYTFEEYKTVESLFKEDSNYLEYIKSIIQEKLANEFITDEQKKTFLDSFELKLDGNVIVASSPYINNFNISIELSLFNEEYLNIFD